MLQAGDKAPLFEAESTKGPIRLKEHIGKQAIVLIFYPKDETPICTKQLCAVRDSKAEYEKAGALVLGVNPGTLEDHQRFAQRNRYDFPLVSDIDGQIREMYEVRKGFLSFLAEQQRIVYVIGRSGLILYARKGNPPTEEILDAISKEHSFNR